MRIIFSGMETPQTTTHEVVKGDSLGKIAKRLSNELRREVTVKELIDLNGIKNPNFITTFLFAIDVKSAVISFEMIGFVLDSSILTSDTFDTPHVLELALWSMLPIFITLGS